MVTRPAIALFTLALLAAPAPADDVKLKARAALALAQAQAESESVRAAPARPEAAPAPRAAAPRRPKLPYSEGYRLAAAEQVPLVIYVGTDGPAPAGAVAAKAESFGDAPKPAVLVGFPQGNQLYIDATLRGEVSPEAVQRAVDAAKRKIDTPAKDWGKLAPPPLDYQI